MALIDGMGALLLVAILYVGTGAIGSEIDRIEAEAMDVVGLEDLRSEIRDTVEIMNITSQPLDANDFEIGGVRFSSRPPDSVKSQAFFLSDDLGVRVFYIAEKD